MHFVDDYAADDVLRSDPGLLWLLTVGDSAPPVVEAVPLHLGYCHTTVARDEDANWIRARTRPRVP